jgi:vacuolar-type H+-ATPase subunit H
MSPADHKALLQAAKDLRYLLARGYPRELGLKITGDRWGLKGTVSILGFTTGFYVDHTGEFSLGDVSSYRLIDSQQLAQARQASQEEARKAAEATEKMRQEILETAKKEAETIKAQARKEAEQEKEQIATDLQRQAAELSLQMTRKVVSEGIDEKTQRKLVDQFLAELGEA